jgi:hypothetical protein
MRVTHSARRSLAAAVLALALAACGKDHNQPSTFDPEGTSADMAAAQDAFVSPQTASFAAVGVDISTVMNGSPLVASSSKLATSRPSASSARYARQLAALVSRTGPGRIQASAASVPAEVAGKTFVWDVTTDAYVASDLTGAPSNGVRFVLYAIDPVTLRPVEPTVEVGYVDLIDQSTETAIDVRVKVVEGSVVYLDYDASASATATGGVVTISGFASNGTTRADFNLKNTITQNASGLVLSLDYDLNVPSRDLALNWTATIANISDTDVAVTVDLSVSGPNGNVRIVGTYGTENGTFTVKVNGDLFASVSLGAGDPVITGSDGGALTPAEEQSLREILDYYLSSADVFTELTMPLG